MLLVKTKIKESKIQGIGLFADQFIKKGTIIWKFTPGFDLKFALKEFNKLPLKARDYLDIYSFNSGEKGEYILPIDNARFFNHSKKSNSLTIRVKHEKEVIVKAKRNISKGEELTENYATFEKDFKKYWDS